MIIRVIKYAIISFGCLSLVLFFLCLTPVPFHVWYNLSLKKAGINRTPEFIVVLGGGGMPSETGLMRTWYAAKLGNTFKESKLIIALPGNTRDSLSSVNLMKKELIIRGIAPDRILIESLGTNTRSQALQVYGLIEAWNHRKPDNPNSKTRFNSLAIVTSPEHLYRSIRTFKKAGFFLVDGLPAFDNAIEADITFIDSRLGGRKWIPDMGKNITVRYQFWSQLRYEELMLREILAISYYWIKGWI
jgi:uncharacterized SAM-binding protein YcdF (DUF218 family)